MKQTLLIITFLLSGYLQNFAQITKLSLPR